MRPSRAMRHLWLLVLLSACEGPALYLPAGATVPSVTTDEDRASRLDENDGVPHEVSRVHAFVDGEVVWYWGFGLVSGDVPMELYLLCRRGAGRCVPLDDHPPLAAALPGDPDYSPFGREILVEVTDRYAGERITSVEALSQAVARGLVLAPAPTDRFREIVQVHPDTRLEVAPGTMIEPTPIYGEGFVSAAFDFAATHGSYFLVDGAVRIRNVYVLTRDGEAMPLHEGARMTDLTGDGDTNDTNNVFGVALGDPEYTPLWRMVRVTVPSTYASIDTAMDETMAEYMDAHDMFDVAPDYTITPIVGRVVSFEETTMLIDCPIQSAPGAL
jgi:hypothetical protein